MLPGVAFFNSSMTSFSFNSGVKEFLTAAIVSLRKIFKLLFKFKVMHTLTILWYTGSYTIMAKPIKSLELHYPMIQFLINNNYSMSPCTLDRIVRVGFNHFISNKGDWNNCFSKFSNQLLLAIFISPIYRASGKSIQLLVTRTPIPAIT